MAWSLESAAGRAAERYEQTEDLVIADVTREIDFDLISRTKPRRVVGTHFYVDVANFTKQLNGEIDDDGEALMRLLHIFAREASRIVSADFDGQKVHFQGPRLHGIAYRPVSSESEMAVKAVLICLAIRHMVAVFNEELDLSGDSAWTVAAGLDHGRCVATKNGAGGDQELLFLGSAANHAAKTLGKTATRMTDRVRELLPTSFDPAVTQLDGGGARVWLSAGQVEQLATDRGWRWTEDQTRTRLRSDVEKYPPGSVTSSQVNDFIDKARLTLSRTKRVDGVAIFADVDGFTSYIDGLEQIDENLVEAVRVFHVLRGVMRDSAVRDFDAFRVQYQGDRMQALVYRPVGSDHDVVYSAVKLAAALATVARDIVPNAVGGGVVHALAIGLSWGKALVTRFGEHGNTDLISLGPATATAASIQQRLGGDTIGIDSGLYALLPEWLQGAFKWSSTAIGYTAIGLDWHRFSLLEDAERKSSESVPASTRRRDPRPMRPWLVR